MASTKMSLLFSTVAAAAIVYALEAPSFEAATIKPAAADAAGQFIRMAPTGGTLSVMNMTLLQVIKFAYGEGLGTTLEITGGPNWIDKDRFDIEAKATAAATPAERKLMLRSLLTDRFGLKTHMTSKEVNVYAMTLARSDGKLGPKVEAWNGKCQGREPPPAQPKSPRCGAFFRPPGMVLEGVSMGVVADMLSTPVANLGRPVIDKTGLTGEYTMTLEFQFRLPGPAGQAAPPADDFAPSLFTALQEQFGLKLQSTKGNIDVLVIDGATRPTEN